MSGSGRMMSRYYPFTEAQWQELETQALVYKYMVSGLQVPPELIFSVRRSLDSNSSSLSFGPFPPHQMGGWGEFQVGYGRKADPEPGRCRRTDGKKWRCSKEAYPDSKYCEKHMHRGKHRSRKHVEPQQPPPALSIGATACPPTSSCVVSASGEHEHHHPTLHPFLTTSSSSSSSTRPPPDAVPFPHPYEASSHHLQHNYVLNPGSYSQSHKDGRYYMHGKLSEVDYERSFFPEASGAETNYSQAHDPYQGPIQFSSQPQDHRESHSFVLGPDYKSAEPIKPEKEDQPHKPLHHFFGK
ncbi:growth-regulating factor 5-like [Syzygium oleosum]|uniref:growth-regulating factor 5-like n=1 Tax=Syzygium oleosum TaxID=219896 RepID=UPI0011D1B50A|nr:growth-regulating factor 5-like [Syzygium oleosum]